MVLLAPLLPGAALAQDLIDEQRGTWDDGTTYRAELRAGEEGGTILRIYETGESEALVVDNPDFVWRGGLPSGQTPTLDLATNGNLIVRAGNSAVGRTAWEQRLTLVRRDGEIWVGGYTFQSYDRHQEYDPVDCDVNLMTGQTNINGQPGETPHRAIAAWAWSPETAYDLGLCPAE